MIYDFSPMDEGLRGYVWLFPVAGGRAERRRHAHAVAPPARRRDRAPAAAHAGAPRRRAARRRARLARLALRPRARIAAPHVLCVGDAAGIDALTGEGIAVGLEQGPLAARAIARALDCGDFSFASYARGGRAAPSSDASWRSTAGSAALLYAPSGFVAVAVARDVRSERMRAALRRPRLGLDRAGRPQAPAAARARRATRLAAPAHAPAGSRASTRATLGVAR